MQLIISLYKESPPLLTPAEGDDNNGVSSAPSRISRRTPAHHNSTESRGLLLLW